MLTEYISKYNTKLTYIHSDMDFSLLHCGFD